MTGEVPYGMPSAVVTSFNTLQRSTSHVDLWAPITDDKSNILIGEELIPDQQFVNLAVDSEKDHIAIYRNDTMPLQGQGPRPDGVTAFLFENPIDSLVFEKNPANKLWLANVDRDEVNVKMMTAFLHTVALRGLKRIRED